jgi:hypothetical protein
VDGGCPSGTPPVLSTHGFDGSDAQGEDQPPASVGKAFSRISLPLLVACLVAIGLVAAVLNDDPGSLPTDPEAVLFQALGPKAPLTDIRCPETSPGEWRCDYRRPGWSCTAIVAPGEYEPVLAVKRCRPD